MKFFNLKNPFMWGAFLGATSIIFGFIFNATGIHWTYTATWIPWVGIGTLAVVAIVFAFFVNPIKALIKKIKERRG